MSSSALVRWGAIGFVLGGVTWAALGFLDMLGPITAPADSDHLSQEQVRERILHPDVNDVLHPVVDIVVLLLLALGLVGLHALQKGSYGRIGWAGFYTALAATGIRLLVAVADAAGVAYLLWSGPLFLALGILLLPVRLVGPPVGLLGSLLGFVLLGLATLRARVLPRWCGVLLIVVEPVATAYGVWFLLFLPLPRALLGAFPPEEVAFWGPWAIWRGLVLVVLGYVLWLRRGASTQLPHA